MDITEYLLDNSIFKEEGLDAVARSLQVDAHCEYGVTLSTADALLIVQEKEVLGNIVADMRWLDIPWNTFLCGVWVRDENRLKFFVEHNGELVPRSSFD